MDIVVVESNKLSKNVSSNSTNALESLGEIKDSSKDVAQKIDLVVTYTVTETNKIIAALSDITARTEVMFDKVTQSMEFIDQVNQEIQQVANFSEESATATQQTAASIEDQTNSIEQFTAGTYMIKDVSNSLMDLSGKVQVQMKSLIGKWQPLPSNPWLPRPS